MRLAQLAPFTVIRARRAPIAAASGAGACHDGAAADAGGAPTRNPEAAAGRRAKIMRGGSATRAGAGA